MPKIDVNDVDFDSDDIDDEIDALFDDIPAIEDSIGAIKNMSDVPEITKIDIPYEDDNSTLFMSLDKEDGVLSFLNIPNLPTISTFMAGLWWVEE